MWYRALADVVLLVHLGFVVFVVVGGLLAFRWPRVSWVHVPLTIYGAVIEFVGFVCPLTPLEVSLRKRGGEAGYAGGFIEHYITATIYPAGLTRQMQIVMGLALVAITVIVYTILWTRHSRLRRGP